MGPSQCSLTGMIIGDVNFDQFGKVVLVWYLHFIVIIFPCVISKYPVGDTLRLGKSLFSCHIYVPNFSIPR